MLLFARPIVRNGVVKKSNANIMRILNLFIFLLTAWKVSIVDLLIIIFDVRITRTCKNATILIIAAPKIKFNLEKKKVLSAASPLEYRLH